MAEPLRPSMEEINNFLAATVLVAVAFIAYRRAFSIEPVVVITAFSALTIFSREVGQRLVASSMAAEVELNLSLEGSAMTAFGALMSFLTSLPIILLFPLFNDYDVESYEHWAKSIDAMWIKRKFWIASGGILSLFLGWGILWSTGLKTGAEIFSLFLVFQLLPFDYSQIPTGALDGSIIIRWSGFIWLVMMGLAILSLLAV